MTYRAASGGAGAVHYGNGNPNGPTGVQGASNGASSGAVTTTTSGSVTSGNLLVVLLQTESTMSSPSTLSVSDNLSTTWHYITSSTGNSGGVNAAVYYGVAGGTGTCSVQCSSLTGNYVRITVRRIQKC